MKQERKKQSSEQLALQRAFNKIAVYKFFTNLNARFLKFPHIKISVQSGRANNNFNRAFNMNENIQLSTLLRYWRAIQQLLENDELVLNDDETPLTFESLMDDELNRILDIANQINDVSWKEEIESQDVQHFLQGLKVYAKQLSEKNLLLPEENQAFFSLVEKIKPHGGR